MREQVSQTVAVGVAPGSDDTANFGWLSTLLRASIDERSDRGSVMESAAFRAPAETAR